LTQEVVKRKFPTKTRNIPGLIKARVSELIKRGIVRRPGDRPGVALGQQQVTAKPATKQTNGHATNGHKKTAPAIGKTAIADPTPSLRALLTDLLAQSPRPLKARELAELIKAHGYPTKSRDFTNVIWVAISKMDNVENLAGKGYRLKKSKAAANGK
jgi:hypothetical protein